MQKAFFHRDKVSAHPARAWRADPAWDNAMAPAIIRVPSLNALLRQIIEPYRMMPSIICILVKAFLRLFHHCEPRTSGAAGWGAELPIPQNSGTEKSINYPSKPSNPLVSKGFEHFTSIALKITEIWGEIQIESQNVLSPALRRAEGKLMLWFWLFSGIRQWNDAHCWPCGTRQERTGKCFPGVLTGLWGGAGWTFPPAAYTEFHWMIWYTEFHWMIYWISLNNTLNDILNFTEWYTEFHWTIYWMSLNDKLNFTARQNSG